MNSVRMMFFAYQDGLVRPPAETLPEHQAILEGLRARNPDASETAMRLHLRRSMERLEREAEAEETGAAAAREEVETLGTAGHGSETMLSDGDKNGDRFRMRWTIDSRGMSACAKAATRGEIQMNRRRLFRGIVFVGVFALAVGVSAAQAQTVLKFSHTDNPGGSRQDAAEFFGKKVEEYTQGRYKIQVFPSGQLANDPKAVELLQLGGIDFTVTATGSYATHLRSLNLSALPFLVDTYEQGWKLYDESKWFQNQFAQLPAKGFRVLSTFEAGFRSFTTKMPLNSPEDAKGKKIRIYPNDMIRWIMESIGFSPVVLPVTEVYLAIQQGTVIGQENPIDTIYSLRFYEVAPYITLTHHVYSPIPLTISEATWKKFSDADKAAVKKAADEAAAFQPERGEGRGGETTEGDGGQGGEDRSGRTSNHSARRCSRSMPRPRKLTDRTSTSSWARRRRSERRCPRSNGRQRTRSKVATASGEWDSRPGHRSGVSRRHAGAVPAT